MKHLASLLFVYFLLGFSTKAWCDVSTSSIPSVYPGCTDPIALNYDEEATVDDGSCVYSIGPDLIIIDVTPGATFCNGVNHPVYNFQVTLVNIGTEVVNSFCLDDFLSSTDFTCYNGPIGIGMQIEPLDTITVGGSFVISNGWNTGQMNFMTINSIPGEIVTGNNNFVFQMPLEEDCEGPDPDPESCDTVYIEVPVYLTDTLYIDNYIYTTDTVYEYITDTVYEYITEYVTEYVTDTVYEYVTEYITDTLYITETEYIVDTLYITETVTDTVYITEVEYLIDTLYITEFIIDTLFIDNYIYVTDTVTEYIVQEIWIDCETGLPCYEEPPGLDCPDWTTIHAPNTFTPNKDGLNDVWHLVYDLDCWEDVEFWIYDRWGVKIYHAHGNSFDGYPYWDGSVRGGNHYVSDGVYTYIFRGKKVGRVDIIKESGHITVFR